MALFLLIWQEVLKTLITISSAKTGLQSMDSGSSHGFNAFEKAASDSDKAAHDLRTRQQHLGNRLHQQVRSGQQVSMEDDMKYRVLGYMAQGRDFEASKTREYGKSDKFDLVKPEPFIGFDPTVDRPEGPPERRLDLLLKHKETNQHLLVEFKRGHKAYDKDFRQMDTLDLNTEMDASMDPSIPVRTVRYDFAANHKDIGDGFIRGLQQLNKNPKINVRARSGSMTSGLDHDVSIDDFHKPEMRHPR